MERDIHFMRRALELARLGLGSVSPNPLVGCVIVADDRIIGEGWHQKFGSAHAEVNAVQSVTERSLLKEATVYVNLEPCAHFGKTPPCADMLVNTGVHRVVIANRDSNPQVAGKGIEKLRAAGIEVTENVLEKAGRQLNRRFFTNVEQGIPYVILKWAESADGFMAGREKQPIWISSEFSRQQVHQWRSEEDAVLVGTNTAEIDNPKLNVRHWTGRNPLRVVIDKSLRLSSSLHLFDKSQSTICYNRVRDDQQPGLELVKIDGENFLHEMLLDLYRRNIGSLIVEGGSQTLQSFITGGWWHEARTFRSSKVLQEGIVSPVLRGVAVSEEVIGGDRLTMVTNSLPTRI